MKKTALTELIDRCDEMIAKGYIEMQVTKTMATELLQKEREDIEEAYLQSKTDRLSSDPKYAFRTSKQYFKDTYQ